MKILLIEDDAAMADLVRRGLEGEGYTVDVAADGHDGLWMAGEGTYGLIVLDILLPGLNGFQICGKLRDGGDWTPILMLTAKDGEYDQTEALDTGADDYLVKPFSFPVLLARVRALLRRATTTERVPALVGELRIDRAGRRVWRGDQEIELTMRQYQVLEFLAARPGQVRSKQDILAGVWPHDFDGDPNIVEVYVRRLRRAVDEPFERPMIETVRGVGYRLATTAPASEPGPGPERG